MNIKEELFKNQDLNFREFNSRLMPNIDKETIIGVKTPILKKIAKELIKSGEAKNFFKKLPHEFFEENQLHAFIISEIKDCDEAVFELERFLPFVDNWATCDQLILKAVAKEPERILEKVFLWFKSEETYTVRFGTGILMRYFLDERFNEKYLRMVAEIKSEEYYINMMSAWYFATALAKQPKKTLPLFYEKALDPWVHNKAISKARESRRISPELKEELNKLKIKNCKI